MGNQFSEAGKGAEASKTFVSLQRVFQQKESLLTNGTLSNKELKLVEASSYQPRVEEVIKQSIGFQPSETFVECAGGDFSGYKYVAEQWDHKTAIFVVNHFLPCH